MKLVRGPFLKMITNEAEMQLDEASRHQILVS